MFYKLGFKHLAFEVHHFVSKYAFNNRVRFQKKENDIIVYIVISPMKTGGNTFKLRLISV